MKIDLTDRIASSLADERPFEEKLAEAKASGKLFQIVNTKEGRAIAFHTPEEIAFYEASKEDPKPPDRDVFAELDDLKARLAVLEQSKG